MDKCFLAYTPSMGINDIPAIDEEQLCIKNDYITFDEVSNSEIINVYIPFININNFSIILIF
mgnify:CR=1 FL=1